MKDQEPIDWPEDIDFPPQPSLTPDEVDELARFNDLKHKGCHEL